MTSPPKVLFCHFGVLLIVSFSPQVDRLRNFPSLSELRLQHCPILHEHTAHERRMMLIARLPNVKILNGGDIIPENEREDAERAFIRYYMDSENKPERYRINIKFFSLIGAHLHMTKTFLKKFADIFVDEEFLIM